MKNLFKKTLLTLLLTLSCLAFMIIIPSQKAEAKTCAKSTDLESGCRYMGDDCIVWEHVDDDQDCPSGSISEFENFQ